MSSQVVASSPELEALPNGGAEVRSLAPSGSFVLSAADDRTLIERAQAGDRPAFELLVQHYDRQVLRLAPNLLGDAEEANALYQKAFLKILRNLTRFPFGVAFHHW